jgi:UDP-GlcNAc:undecaprenyl-phosphate GlcNAc-1-phosphate transferase
LLDLEAVFRLFLVSFGASVVLTPAYIYLSHKLGVLDKPNSAHKSHLKPIPYLGGFAILTSLTFSLILVSRGYLPSVRFSTDFALLIGGGLIALLGLSDDLRPKSAYFRLIAQNFVAFISVTILYRDDRLEVGVFSNSYFNYLISILWVVAICNFVNMFDNHDGSASGVSTLVFLGIFTQSFIQDQIVVSTLSLILFSSTLGFVLWNYPPAKIYLGDSGAMLLGLGIGLLSIQLDTSTINQQFSWAIPILLVGTLGTDFTVAVISRIRRGISPMVGDKAHIAHRLLRLGYTKVEATLIIWVITSIYICAAISLNFASLRVASLIILLLIAFYLFSTKFFLSLADE